jgi:dihydrofolate reductase
MKCSVFIATSVDGMIARKDGSVEWLHTAGNSHADMGNGADMGFAEYLSSVDCMIMGRKCMEVISNMNLSPDQWPYGNLHIIVLSNTLKSVPVNMEGKVELYSGDITKLIAQLESEGFHHAYIDGGTTIQGFLKLKLINEITITRAPIILGEGIPLFGPIERDIKLTESKAGAFPNDFVQVKYKVSYL